MTDWSAVEDAVSRAGEGVTVGVSVLGPDGSRWAHNGSRKFRAASTVKVPLMVEIFRQIERGERTLDEVHALKNDARSKGSGVLLHMHEGLDLTLRDLIYLMISISDNTATNMLIRLATMDAVNKLMPELGPETGRDSVTFATSGRLSIRKIASSGSGLKVCSFGSQ